MQIRENSKLEFSGIQSNAENLWALIFLQIFTKFGIFQKFTSSVDPSLTFS